MTAQAPSRTQLMIAIEVARRRYVRSGRTADSLLKAITTDADVYAIWRALAEQMAACQHLCINDAGGSVFDWIVLPAIRDVLGIDDDRGWYCDDCLTEMPPGPMLHDPLWLSIARDDERLCIDCTERRFGRRLTQADLTGCPFNAGWIPFDPDDAMAAGFAPGRALLANGGAS